MPLLSVETANTSKDQDTKVLSFDGVISPSFILSTVTELLAITLSTTALLASLTSVTFLSIICPDPTELADILSKEIASKSILELVTAKFAILSLVTLRSFNILVSTEAVAKSIESTE